MTGLPVFLRLRFFCFSSMRRSSSAAAFASASSSALASAILAIRFCLSATQSGSSSPRLLPCSRSSSASAACRQPAIDLGLQFGLTHLHVPIAHCLGLVFGRIRPDLGAVERDMPDPSRTSRLSRRISTPYEQPGQLFEMPLAELGDGVEIRRIESRDHHEVGAAR
jgi:hypothetical protein